MRGVLPAVLVFGLGLAITVAPLTATALSSPPRNTRAWPRPSTTTWPGSAASSRSRCCRRWPASPATSYLHPQALAAGFRTAVLISGALCAAGGLLAAVTITNPAPCQQPSRCGPCRNSACIAASTRRR